MRKHVDARPLKAHLISQDSRYR